MTPLIPRGREIASTVHVRKQGTFPDATNLADPDGSGPLAAGGDTGTLTTKTVYLDNLVFATVDPYGRATFYAYRPSDSAQIRTVAETVPGGSGIDPYTGAFADVTSLTRDLSYETTSSLTGTSLGGAKYLITDDSLDAAGQTIATTDSCDVTDDTTYDSRGREIKTIQAVGTQVAATSETVYDPQSNVIEQRSPRYFDSSDTLGYQKAYTTMTYTGRNQLASRTVAAGDTTYDQFVTSGTGHGAKATTTYYYNLDGTQAKTIDNDGNDPQFTTSGLCMSTRGC